eukprot:5813768-Prymnesium_polylepis.1
MWLAGFSESSVCAEALLVVLLCLCACAQPCMWSISASFAFGKRWRRTASKDAGPRAGPVAPLDVLAALRCTNASSSASAGPCLKRNSSSHLLCIRTTISRCSCSVSTKSMT